MARYRKLAGVVAVGALLSGQSFGSDPSLSTCGVPSRAITVAVADGFETAYAARRASVVAELEAHAEWCGSARLAADRAAAFEAILHFDPAHEDAHRALKHVKQRDGTWAPAAKKQDVKNANKALEGQSSERLRMVATSLLDAGTELLGKGEDAARRSTWQAMLVADVLAIDPHHEAARKLGGEARREQEWVLMETVDAKLQRGELKQRVQRVVAAVPAPQRIEPGPREAALGIAWTHAVSTPRVRVFTDSTLAEAERVAVMCTAAMDVYSELAGFTSDLTADYSVYVLATSGSRDAFVGQWPGWSDAERTQVKTWAGCGVPGDIHQARWDKDEAHRLDGAVRHTLGLLTLRELGFDHQRCAWAWEGLGIYLTRELVGTRYTWYSTAPASADVETKDLLGRLMLADVNWINEFYQRAKRGRAPTLAKLCGTKIDQFGVDDILASYSLAAYLIEGRSADLPSLLRALAAADDGGAAAIAQLFGGDLLVGDARLLRWLSERK